MPDGCTENNVDPTLGNCICDATQFYKEDGTIDSTEGTHQQCVPYCYINDNPALGNECWPTETPAGDYYTDTEVAESLYCEKSSTSGKCVCSGSSSYGANTHGGCVSPCHQRGQQDDGGTSEDECWHSTDVDLDSDLWTAVPGC